MSCLYPKLIKNPKFLPNKKNGYNPPECTDERLRYVPASCGRCIECRKKRRREWMVRLSEELRGGGKPPLFVTLTVNNANLKKCKSKDNNERATELVRKFLENIRSSTKHSVKHFLVTELGEENKRIHLHGFIWADKELLQKKWIYGFIHIGDFVNEKSINYMTKYMLKCPPGMNFVPKVLASSGIGKGYTERKDVKRNIYKEGETEETYRFRNGSKMYLPQYYRNKIYTDEEKQKLWIEKQEKGVVYIAGEPVNPNNWDEYNNILNYYQERGRRLFKDNPEQWDKDKLKKRREKIRKYLKKAHNN